MSPTRHGEAPGPRTGGDERHRPRAGAGSTRDDRRARLRAGDGAAGSEGARRSDDPTPGPGGPAETDCAVGLGGSDRLWRPAGAGLSWLPAWSRPGVPGLIALLTLAAGIVDVVSALTPELRDRLNELRGVLPGSVSRQAAAFTVVTGMLLVLLSIGLRRRKRRAWRAVVVLLAVSVFLHVAKGLDYEEATASGLLLVALILTRREFQAKGDPATRWRALGVGLALVVASIVVGLALLTLRHSRIVGPHPLSAELEHILFGLVGVSGPLHFVSDRFTDLVTRVLLTMGLLTVATTVYVALRPPEPRPVLTADDETRMRGLLDRHGAADSLGYFALRRDKSVVWSPSGKACVAFRVVSGVMLASGDPLGDNEAWPGAIKAFLREAAEHAWTPAVIGCSEAGGTAWARAGLSALEFGDEAVVDVADFTLEGRAMRNVRQAVGRVERAGYSVEACRMSGIAPDAKARLAAQAATWRGTETERGYSMALGRLGDGADDQCVAVMAFSHRLDGKSGPKANPAKGADPAAEPVLRGMLHFVPWGPDGLSLDLMVRDKSADNGLNEYLIVSALRAARDLGIKRVSLNFAFFRSALERGEKLGAGPVLRAWRGLLIFLSRWFQIDSLYRFNAKFQPCWYPRFVCFPSTSDLPRIALAMLEAEAFLVWPRLTARDVARRLRRLVRRPATASC